MSDLRSSSADLPSFCTAQLRSSYLVQSKGRIVTKVVLMQIEWSYLGAWMLQLTFYHIKHHML